MDPKPQTVNAFETAQMTATFKNIDQIRWYQGSIHLAEFDDQSTLERKRTQAGDEGYYHAVGFGPSGQIATEKALLQIKSEFKHIDAYNAEEI